jgi:hypothetical protein
MDVPREIFDLITNYESNINLFKTCKQFYWHKDSFYKTNIFDYEKIICKKYFQVGYTQILNNTVAFEKLQIFRVVNCNTVNLPASITHLTFDDYFNKPVSNLPVLITHLTFGAYFNQPVDNLPASVTHLTFGSYFNQPVDNLPASVTHLTFGSYFNQPVDNLPALINHLTFGS